MSARKSCNNEKRIPSVVLSLLHPSRMRVKRAAMGSRKGASGLFTGVILGYLVFWLTVMYIQGYFA